VIRNIGKAAKKENGPPNGRQERKAEFSCFCRKGVVGSCQGKECQDKKSPDYTDLDNAEKKKKCRSSEKKNNTKGKKVGGSGVKKPGELPIKKNGGEGPKKCLET